MGSVLLAFLILTVPQIPSHVDHIERIRRVTFIGTLDAATDRELREASSSIEEGKVYTAKGLGIAIAGINRLSMFHKVTRGDCSVTRSSVHPGTVDIEIRLKPKLSGGPQVR